MKEPNLNKTVISYFANLSEATADTTILAELDSIRNGANKEKVTAARFYYNKDNYKYQQLKKRLPAVTFSGRYNSKRTSEYLIDYTSFLILDIDKINDTELLEKQKENLFAEVFVVSVWVSPSGVGLKVLVKIDCPIEYHSVAFYSLVNYFKKKYEIFIDPSGSDVSRLCFSSYDENLLLKAEFAGYTEEQIIENYAEVPILKEVAAKKIDLPTLNKSNKILLSDPVGRNNFNDRNTMQAILKYLRFQKKSITSSYEQWYRVALAIANSFTFDIGSKYFIELCKLDNEAYSDEKSSAMLEYCYLNRRMNVIKFATIIHYAQEKGFELNYKAVLKTKKTGKG